MTLKISISGVRGTVPDSLTPEICLDFAKAFGTFLEGGKVVVATDTRKSSEFIKGVVFSGLLSTGCKVIDLGICPTPTVGIMIRELKAQGGIVITASHNPLPWNGIKFMREDGIFLSEEQAQRLIKIYESKKFRIVPVGSLSSNSLAIETHLRKVLKAVRPAQIRRKKFKVAVDACNGAGSIAMIKLLEKLGCKVFPINCQPHLPFPHPPEPVAENLGDLRKLVKERNADLGIALDSDADRLALISEQGEALGEELTLVLAVKFALSSNPFLSAKRKIVVVNLSTTQAIEDVCRKFGARVIRTKIGEVHVAKELKSVKGLIGGEGNGGVIYPRVGFNRDSLTAAALILNYLASSQKKISKLIEDIPSYKTLKTKIECHNLDEAYETLDKIKSFFKGEDLILTDGIKVIFPKSWVHIRPSNTEPIIRIIAEAKEKEETKKLIEKVFQALGKDIPRDI